ncbi:MAG TPA: glycerol-3-phosphate dehydrogenase/oxidase [Acidimicrobiales bacterium]|nr:glycerol-3-phosphate dehydrogenase/oxidase [Acidimicrobiales bacterium]
MSGPGDFDRATALDRLASTTFDVLVVGGGITGVGVALDAASRGLRTALVERDDFAAGTSSKSSKLVHGGLRYLQQGEVRLVYQALRERQILRRTAPHLVHVLPFLIPIFTKDGLLNRRLARALGSAMWMYDFTGGLRIGKLHKRLTTDEAMAHMPTLRRDRMAGAYLYYDAQTDDARLVLEVARTAALDHGATIANRARLTGIDKDDQGRVRGATVEADGRSIEVRARTLVNATGVWSDDIRALDEGTHPDSIRPAKGVHITVPWDLVRNDIAAVIPVPKDKRSVFVVAWGGSTYIGTTDTDYTGDVDEPMCTREDVEYLLRAINGAIEGTIEPSDITGTWAGLRPLVKRAGSARTADLSRMHKVSTSGSGVVSINGGKLTTYREMAADTVDEVVDLLGERAPGGLHRRSRTRKLPLRGTKGHDEARTMTAPGLDQAAVDHLVGRHGGESTVLLAMVEADPELGRPLVEGLPYLRAEAVYAVRHEMAATVDDVLSRRTRARLLAAEASMAAADDVAALIGPVLGWSADEEAAQAEAYRTSVEAELDAAGLHDEPAASAT